MTRDQWGGYIKDYDGGTLMECRISRRVNYLVRAHGCCGTTRAQRPVTWRACVRAGRIFPA